MASRGKILISLEIREIETKTIVKYHFSHQIGKKKIDYEKKCEKDVGKHELPQSIDRDVNWQNCFREQSENIY